jgi:hypothetical protein
MVSIFYLESEIKVLNKSSQVFREFQKYSDHPPYSPDLAPWDYHKFPGLKNITLLLFVL